MYNILYTIKIYKGVCLMQKNFYLNEKEDRDIIKFLEKAEQSNRRSEVIRKALRLLMKHEHEKVDIMNEEKVRGIVVDELIKHRLIEINK